MSNDLPSVGVIGLGTMGAGIAGSIRRAGFPLAMFDLNSSACAPFAEGNATIAPSTEALVRRSDIVISCLPSIEASRSVVARVAEAGTSAIYIETGTVGTEAIREFGQTLAASGIAVIDGPVSGGGPRAEAGTLTSIVAGEAAAAGRARPVISAYSETIFVVAEQPGPAQTIKLINNMLSAVGMIAAFEGMVMGVKAGLDPDVMLDVLNASTGRNSATVDKIPRFVLPRRFGGHIATGLKDLGLYGAEAEELGVPAWMGPRALDVYRAACEAGFDKETFRIIEFMERLAGGVMVTGTRPPYAKVDG